VNAFIASLNSWSECVLSLVWPMFWQSSLLILVLVSMDLALRRRVRAAVRYLFWLVLLVKLVLPPSIALPSGVSWWVLPREAAESNRSSAFRVTYGAKSRSTIPQPATQRSAGLPSVLPSRSVFVLAAGLSISLGLLLWMLICSRRVTARVKGSAPAPDWLCALLEQTRRAVGLRQTVHLRVTDQNFSPAVCGLFRSTLLVPRALIEKLSLAELRAVLLHELIHLRRGDVWVNCGQALLQIAYWWHPLVWLANARIRFVREEAVDDAVMAALGVDAAAYPPTLLQVARLALERQAASLGLVGILESPGWLQRRIERLLDFRPPRRTGVTYASVICVMGFAAVALPMGPAPAVAPPAQRLSSLVVAPPEPGPPAKQENPIPPGPIVGPKAQPNPDVIAASDTNRLYTRVIHLDRATFAENLRRSFAGPPGNTNVSMLARALLSSLELDLKPPKAFFYNELKGDLIIRGTMAELNLVEDRVAQLSRTPAQVMVSIKFLKLPAGAGKDFSTRANRKAVLTEAETRAELARLKSLEGVEFVNEGSLTTLSGRQAQIQWSDEPGLSAQAATRTNTFTNGFTNQFHDSFSVDIYPVLEKDDFTIRTTVSAATTEFLGFDDPGFFVTDPPMKSVLQLPVPVPHFRRLGLPAQAADIPDGRTWVLGGADLVDNSHAADAKANRSPDHGPSAREFLFFITPTLIYADGERIHPTDGGR